MGYPRNDLFGLNQRLPGLGIPFKIITLLLINTRHSTDKNDGLVTWIINLNIAQNENIRISAYHTLYSHIPKLPLRMRTNFIMLRFNKMKDKMRSKPIFSLIITEPFPTSLIGALHHAIRIRYSTEGASMRWPIIGGWVNRWFVRVIIGIWLVVRRIHKKYLVGGKFPSNIDHKK